MGACIEKGREPLLVMEHMENGSLYGLLHNGTMQMERDVVIPIIKDIVAGELASRKWRPCMDRPCPSFGACIYLVIHSNVETALNR